MLFSPLINAYLTNWPLLITPLMMVQSSCGSIALNTPLQFPIRNYLFGSRTYCTPFSISTLLLGSKLDMILTEHSLDSLERVSRVSWTLKNAAILGRPRSSDIQMLQEGQEPTVLLPGLRKYLLFLNRCSGSYSIRIAQGFIRSQPFYCYFHIHYLKRELIYLIYLSRYVIQQMHSILKSVSIALILVYVAAVPVVLIITDHLVLCNEGFLRSFCLQANILVSEQVLLDRTSNASDVIKDSVLYFDRLIRDIDGFVFTQGVTSKIIAERVQDQNALRDYLKVRYQYVKTISETTNSTIIVYPYLSDCGNVFEPKPQQKSSQADIDANISDKDSRPLIPKKCQLVREQNLDSPLLSYYQSLALPVQNFSFQEGFSYTLSVQKEEIFIDPPYLKFKGQAQMSVKYNLVKIQKKVKVKSELFGVWNVVQILGNPINSFQFTITPTIIYYFFCEIQWADYSATGKDFIISTPLKKAESGSVTARTNLQLCSPESQAYGQLISKIVGSVRSYRLLKSNKLILLGSRNQMLLTMTK